MQPPFRKSVRCDTGSCVEVSVGDEVQVRNSTDPAMTAKFTKQEWQVFVAGVKSGEFDVVT
jgi:NAD kinase